MLGLTRKQARERFDSIIEFAELEEFVDLPLKNYSSGMSVRLAFAVTVEVDADVLLIDEVLAVGDAAFQQKCFEQFEQLKREGRTIVLVTHDMSAVERFCDRAMLIDRGKMLHDRRPARDRARLQRAQLRPPRRRRAQRRGPLRRPRRGRDQGRLVRGRRAASGSRTSPQGQPCTMCMDVHFHAAMDEPVFAFHLRNEPRHIVFATSTALARRVASGSFAAGETARVTRALRQLARAEPLHGQPVGRARRHRRRPASTCARTSPRSSSTARASRAGSPTCRTALRWSAHERARRHAPQPAGARPATPAASGSSR